MLFLEMTLILHIDSQLSQCKPLSLKVLPAVDHTSQMLLPDKTSANLLYTNLPHDINEDLNPVHAHTLLRLIHSRVKIPWMSLPYLGTNLQRSQNLILKSRSVWMPSDEGGQSEHPFLLRLVLELRDY